MAVPTQKATVPTAYLVWVDQIMVIYDLKAVTRPANYNTTETHTKTDLNHCTDNGLPLVINNHDDSPNELNKLNKLSSSNLDKLSLCKLAKSAVKDKCKIRAEPPSKIPPPSSIHTKSNNPNKLCNICKRTFKGKRGLFIHLGREPGCRRNAPQSSSSPDHNVPIPRIISNTVKSPSTSVESLNAMCGDGYNTKFIKHDSSQCKLCPLLIHKEKFVSSSTHRIHNSEIPNDITSVDCNSKNVIYLITCRKCNLQYVGETIQPLRGRICHHVSHIRRPDVAHSSHILANHFSKGHCKGATFTVNIIEKLSGDGRDNDGKLDPTINRIRKKKETEWMLKLQTVYPFGLNDRIGDEYMENRNHDNVFSKFPPLKKIKERFKIRTKYDTSNTFVVDNFIYIINESIRTNLKNTMNLIRVLLSSMKRSHCRILYDKITASLSEKHDNYPFSQFFLAALDIIKSKIGNPPIPTKSTKRPPSNICRITFANKAIDFINIHKIFKNLDILQALPENLRNDAPMVVYSLTNTIRSKIFNYKSFVQSLDIDTFLSDDTILPCDCDHSTFTDAHHDHIITGDLNIVDNDKLRKLISKGPKYREPKRFSYAKAKNSIVLGLNECINTWSTKQKVPVAEFKDWKYAVIRKIDERISFLESSNNNKKYSKNKSDLHDTDVIACLDELQQKYVMVPIDKAANNVAFICKRFYAHVLMKELGLTTNEPSSTYTPINNLSHDQIITQHKSEMKNTFNITVKDNMLTLPDIYWLPKLHKNPLKFRFIIASKQCTIKALSKDISSIFTLFQKHIETYHNKAHFYSGVKTNWIVHNRDAVLSSAKKSSIRRSAKRVSSFDFSTLYTKIPHDKLIDVLNQIIDFTFKGGTRKIIYVNKSGIAHWANKKNKLDNNYTKESIIKAVSFLIHNCYFNLGGKLFKQIIGIPMGSDPAPAFANLFLFFYESSWLNKIKKSNNVLARKFGQVFRYIDDLLTLNDGGSFEQYHHEIYPTELQLNKENVDNITTTFLDLHISIEEGIFKTKLFDKRDHFGFQITRLPYKVSNIPNRMFYSTISTECLRICRSTSELEPAVTSIKALISRMVKQGAEINKLKNCIRRSFNKHLIHIKYNTTYRDIHTRIFS